MKILVDDGSSDDTVHLAKGLGLIVFAHDRNYGYGRNQQTCYEDALCEYFVVEKKIIFGFRLGEISCPTRYFDEASSIDFLSSMKYGMGVLATTLKFALQRLGLVSFRLFDAKPDAEYLSRGQHIAAQC